MIPEKVTFTDLEIDPEEVLSPRRLFSYMIPRHWTRYAFTAPYGTAAGIRNLDRWLEKNIEGRWTCYTSYAVEGVMFVVHFERANDAVMFRLMDGETEFTKMDDI